MIVTLTGAYRNVGDHLIGERAHRLLREFVDPEIVNLSRTSIAAQDYDTMNRARAVILCGGPSYQKNIYPNIYPLDLDRLETPVVPLGLGWKGHLQDQPNDLAFSPSSKRFIQRVHEGISNSSCRDELTVDALGNIGIDNVIMTGCPAWYDMEYAGREFSRREPRNIVFSDPAAVNLVTFQTLRQVRQRFPRSSITLALHHGFYPRLTRRGALFAAQHLALATYAKSLGISVANLAASLEDMTCIYDSCDLHIGFRVHAHIYCLSHRQPSYLISEDSRGVGQCLALNCPVMKADDPNLGVNLDTALDQYLTEGADQFQATAAALQRGYDRMQAFLQTIDGT